MNKFIEEKVQYCHSCKVHQKMPVTVSTRPWENAKLPWVRVHLDFAGLFVGKMFLILFDSYSKWIEFPFKILGSLYFFW